MDWKIIEECPRYEISQEGVRPITGKRRFKLMKPCIGQRGGYVYYNLQYEDGSKSKYFHRLLAEAFIPNPDNKPFIDHINRDRSDNRIENLRWASKEENSRNNENRARGYIRCVWVVNHPDYPRRQFETEEQAIEYRDSFV
jgi:hypothetical protein